MNWYEIIIESKNDIKFFERMFEKFGKLTITKEGKNTSFKIWNYDEKSETAYFITIVKNKEDNKFYLTHFEFLQYEPHSDEDKNKPCKSKSLLSINLSENDTNNIGFSEDMTSLKAMEDVLLNLYKTRDFERFVQAWKRESYKKNFSDKEGNEVEQFGKYVSRYAGVKGKEIEKGMILYSKWGYGQTNVTFYKVIDRKNEMVSVQELESKKIIENNYAMKALEYPSNKTIGSVMKKKINDNMSDGESVKINNNETAVIWNGKMIETSNWA